MFSSPARTRRRHITAAKIIAGLVLAAVVGLLVFVSMRTERIDRYAVDVVVLDDGSALVRETIDYDFGAYWRHGILRKIPERRDSAGGADSEVSEVAVRSASAPAEVQVSDGYGGTELRIGDPDQTVTGRHRYVIEYRLTGVVVDDKLALDAIGTEWEAPIGDATITLTAPYQLRNPSCHQGETFSSAGCPEFAVTGEKLTAHVSDLGEATGITVYAGRGEAAADPVTALPTGADLGGGSDPAWWLRIIVLILAVGSVGYVIGLIPVTRWARRAGRDWAWQGEGGPVDAVFGGPGLEARQIDDVVADRQATIQFVPPRDLTPSQGGMLLHESVTDNHRVAWLTQHALDGWFAIEQAGKRLRWTAGDDRWAAAPAPLRRIFTGNRTVSLKKYSKRFADGWKLIDDELTHWQKTCGLWDRAAEERSRSVTRKVFGIGVLAALLGLVGLYVLGGSYLWVSLVVAAVTAVPVGAAVAVMANDREYAIRTPAGFAQRQLVEGFRRFFEVSEGRHAREAADRGDLRLYSAWAVALGELERWKSAIATAALPPHTPGVSDVRYISGLSAATHTASTEPSSSNGSGGGGSSFSSSGGDVGGGAGGGGGGSW